MKVLVRVEGSLVRRSRRLPRPIDLALIRVWKGVNVGLQRELDAIRNSERASDPETRRDALERAVRRIWGAPL